MSKTIEYLKSKNYEVVDNQGISVTQHFIQCLEKEFANLEAKLKEKEKERLDTWKDYKYYKNKCLALEKQLEEKEKELNDWKDGTIICKWTDAKNKVKDLEHQLAEKEEVLKELTDAVVVAIDLLGVDVKKAYPKLYNKFLTQQHEE